MARKGLSCASRLLQDSGTSFKSSAQACQSSLCLVALASFTTWAPTHVHGTGAAHGFSRRVVRQGQRVPQTFSQSSPGHPFAASPLLASAARRGAVTYASDKLRGATGSCSGHFTIIGKSDPEHEIPMAQSFAVVEIGGRQYKVSAGDLITTESLNGVDVNDKLALNKVLLLGSSNTTVIGWPVPTDTFSKCLHCIFLFSQATTCAFLFASSMLSDIYQNAAGSGRPFIPSAQVVAAVEVSTPRGLQTWLLISFCKRRSEQILWPYCRKRFWMRRSTFSNFAAERIPKQ